MNKFNQYFQENLDDEMSEEEADQWDEIQKRRIT